MRPPVLAILSVAALIAGCGGSNDNGTAPSGGSAADAPSASTAPATKSASGGTRFPDIKAATLTPAASGGYKLDVTVSSPYDTPDRYADGWRVLAAGTKRVLGKHSLAHGHADEQPFTRTQDALIIPDGIDKITVEGRDQKNGFGGQTVDVAVPSG